MATTNIVIPGSSGGAAVYLEYAWVCAPNAAGQSITANTITTCTLDTEVSDSTNIGSIASNQVTIPAGTYYFEANTNHGSPTAIAYGQSIFGLYNVSDTSWVTRSRKKSTGTYEFIENVKGQFTISTSKAFDLRLTPAIDSIIGDIFDTQFTLSTAGADQRTTLKLWKLA